MTPKLRSLLHIVIVATLSLCYYFFVETHPVNALDYSAKYTVVEDSSYYCRIYDAELPRLKDSSYFVRSDIGRYAFYYSPKHGISKWVAYRLTRSDVMCNKVKRSTSFKKDPVVLSFGWLSPDDKDYYRSSYNKGHLLPSSDRLASKEENKATFSYANVAPQRSRLNSGVWLMIETKIKELAVAYNEVFITVGTIVPKEYQYIGENSIAIPTHFYKCIAFRNNGKWYGYGFIVPNSDDVSNDFNEYIFSINKVEKLTKMDFFPHIEKKTKDKFEKTINHTLLK